MIELSAEVAAALTEGRPVVGLETAVVTHGLPRTPWPATLPLPHDRWRPGEPINVEAARAMSRAVLAAGAAPALTAVLRGALRAGLSESAIVELACDPAVFKASARDLGPLLVRGASAGTTVAGAIATCAAVTPVPIRVFATGGIGGVHPGWTTRPDVSGDLIALAQTPVCVVCAGAKSILDVPATFEILESLGVPVIGCGVSHFPRFVCPPDPALPLPHQLDSPDEIARACLMHWALGNPSAVLVVQPVDPTLAVPIQVYEAAAARAEADARRAGIEGAARTPALLDQIARLTHGASLRANIGLLLANASLAGRIAAAMSAQERARKTT